MDIKQIVNSIFSSNTYFLSSRSSKQTWLIDVGDIEPILSRLSDKQEISAVFITHTHYDHIFGIKKLIERFPNCIIYTSENGRLGLLSEQYNFSKYHDDPLIFDSPNIKILKEESRIQLTKDHFIEVFETPGHDWSSLVFLLDNKHLFTGDSYIPGIKVITSFPKSNKILAEQSTKKILSLCKTDTTIYPGHGDIRMGL